MEKTGVKEFLKRKNVNITVQTYLIDALGAMAFGFICLAADRHDLCNTGRQDRCRIIRHHRGLRKSATGAALGVSIAYALKAPQLVLFSAATVGIAGNELGGPVGALVATVVAAELGKNCIKGNPRRHHRNPRCHHHLRRTDRPVCWPRCGRLYDSLRKPG